MSRYRSPEAYRPTQESLHSSWRQENSSFFNNHMENITDILAENARRTAAMQAPYNPLTGQGSPLDRVAAIDPKGTPCHIPPAMADDPAFLTVTRDYQAWCMLRFSHDFEFWAATCVKIKDKLSGRDIPFLLNRPQRRVLAVLEEMRIARRPIRLIMLKARQWGGSLIYIYSYI